MEEKTWYESKTMWANILAIVADILLNLSGTLSTGGSITVLSVINVILRVVTKTGIKIR